MVHWFVRAFRKPSGRQVACTHYPCGACVRACVRACMGVRDVECVSDGGGKVKRSIRTTCVKLGPLKEKVRICRVLLMALNEAVNPVAYIPELFEVKV